jgi:hypothetical protein
MQPKVSENEVICFIIGPIGDRNAEIGSENRTRYEEAIQVYEHVIQPSCDAVGLRPIRADHLSRPGEIAEQVFRLLRDSPVVVADLSGANPNVMYELGLRHTKGELTVQIGEAGQLPFDVSAIRTIQFRRSEAGLIDARESLVSALREGLDGNYDPVTAFRVWNETDLTAVPEEGPEAIEDDQPGILERLVRMEEALPKLIVTMQEVTSLSAALTEDMNAAQEEVAASDARGGGASGRLSIAVRFSRRLDESAEGMEDLAGRFEEQLRSIDPGVSAILTTLEEDPNQIADAIEFLETLVELGPVFSEFVEKSNASAEVMQQLGGISTSLRAPSRRHSEAIRRLSRAGVVVDNWATRATRLLNEEKETD